MPLMSLRKGKTNLPKGKKKKKRKMVTLNKKKKIARENFSFTQKIMR